MAPCCGHVSGPVTQHLLQTLVAEAGTCTGAVLLPGPQSTAGPRNLHVPLSQGALAAVLPYQAPATADIRKLWCLQEGMTLLNTRTKKK